VTDTRIALMIKSMTGFGRGEVTEGTKKITVEIKSVNNRFLDLSMKMPRKFNMMDAQIRAELKNYIQRGKVDLYVNYEDLSESDVAVKYNHSVAAEYMKYLQQMAEEFHLENDIRVSTLSRFPEVFTTEDLSQDETGLWELLQKAIDEAAQNILDARIREGGFLKEDLLKKMDSILANVDFITAKAPLIDETYQARLTAKVKDMLQDAQIDENRIVQEVTIYSDKVCVDEELVRLRSHVQAVKQALESGEEGVGRKFDFLAQEMNREANTILSKTDDAEVSARGIELKTDIEKVREQIQNIE
jgi:uncharacterized protein (TIGR00255 family)